MQFTAVQSEPETKSSPKVASEAMKAIEYARVLFEKCELALSKKAALEALEHAKKEKNSHIRIEAISTLVRLAAEASDRAEVSKWGGELDAALADAPESILSFAWYIKSVVASYSSDLRLVQSYANRAIQALSPRMKKHPTNDEIREWIKIWTQVAHNYFEMGKPRRALQIARVILTRYESMGLRGTTGPVFMIEGILAEASGQLETAKKWFQKAHTAYLEDRNWFAHLYVLFAYARLERKNRNFTQAYWYLDLMEKAARGPEFGNLLQIIVDERKLLETDAIDLLIDSRKCQIHTRESKGVSLGKQYVLLGILEALTDAHSKTANDADRGLSKSDIIEKVWKEKYRPEVHDNKLYYNINRLRKLIEPDMKQPKYLMNWREGYRLAPGLKVQFVGGTLSKKGKLV